MDLRNRAGREDGPDDLLTERGRGAFNLGAGDGGRTLDLVLGELNSLLSLLTRVIEGGFALGLKALHLLLAESENLGAGGA